MPPDEETPKDKPPKAVSVDPPGGKKPGPKSTPRARTKDKTKTDAPAKPRGQSGRPPELQKRIHSGFMTIGVGVSVINFRDGQIIAEHSDKLAEAWYKVAQTNPHVKAFFETMTTGSAWGEAVFVSAMVALPIAQNHGLIPTDFNLLGNVEPPEEPPVA